MERNPELVVDMVQKLWVLENAEPEVKVPELALFLTPEGPSKVEYRGPMLVDIGEPPNNLSYELDLEATDVVVAERPKPQGLGAGWVVAGGAVLVVGGMVLGGLLF